MKLTRDDLPRLWLPCAILLVLLGAAGTLAWTSERDARLANQELQTATQARNQIEQRLRQVRTEEEDIKQRAGLLLRLKQAGIAGNEQRLEWIEMLHDIQNELRIPGMKYEFGPQAPLDGKQDGGWFASTLRIQFRLLHEEDLLKLLTRIEQQARAMVIVRSCRLAPLPTSGNEAQPAALLGAECEMQWLTVQLPGGKS